jgi:DNA-binding response OmpR family regulator
MGAKQKLVLVLEDETSLVEVLENSLKVKGFKVVTAIDGKEGFKKALKYKPNLILLDILMPKLNGIDMLQELRLCKDAYCREVPVIILTNLTNQDYEKQAKKLGSLDYIIKSNISLTDLVDKISARLA